jgi:hypothetical protein
MALEQVQFQPNIPQVFRLKYDEPKLIEKTGNHMLTLEDGRVVFLKPGEADGFRRFGFRRGDPVQFVLRPLMSGNKIAGATLDFCPAELAPEPAPPRAAKPESRAVQQGVPVGNNGQSSTPVNGNGHAVRNGIPYWDPMTEFLGCYEQALSLAAAIEQMAAGRGRPLHVSDDKVCEIGTALFISRDHRSRGGLR